MLIPIILFWLLLIWGLVDGDLYSKEGGVYAFIWIALLAGFMIFKATLLWIVAPTVLLDIVLLLKIFGGDVLTRS